MTKAVVTLLTADSYLPGALVLLHSLRELHPAPRDFQIVCLVTPETVDAHTIGALRKSGYDLVIGVEPISSGVSGQDGLHLMGRPDLNTALTKLHLFRLGAFFDTIIYLDADTLPLKPISPLFDLTAGHSFSACPDIGWPDCFNSGVMVVRPHEGQFEQLQQMMTADPGTNGSFDGADQGLLNQYFSEDGPGGQWNRLPFTYNVTPSSAYQYAPAYKHYMHKIKLIHFIGPNKPWSNLAWRAASSAPVDEKAYDYNALVDRWYDVYDRNIRPTAVHEPNLAKRFTVPEHVAVWNTPAAAPPDRLDLAELKRAVEKGVAAFQPGQYTSLPLEGRVDLIAPRPKPQPEPESEASVAHAHADSETPRDSHHQSNEHQQHHSGEQQQHHNDHQPHAGDSNRSSGNNSPPQDKAWDASRSAPPKISRPEMVIPMNTVYMPAWDAPPKSQSMYYSAVSTPTMEYPSLPKNVSSNDWYKDYSGKNPNLSNVTPVFPWEERAVHRPKASRSFPRDEKPLVITPKASPKGSPKPTAKPKAKPSPLVFNRPASRKPLSFEDAIASYHTNAWDNISSIGKYAKGLSVLGIGSEQRNVSSAMPSPRKENGNDSADADDEAEGGSYPSPSYFDKHSQTEGPKVSDAKVQASPEHSPTIEAADRQMRIPYMGHGYRYHFSTAESPKTTATNAGSDPRTRAVTGGASGRTATSATEKMSFMTTAGTGTRVAAQQVAGTPPVHDATPSSSTAPGPPATTVPRPSVAAAPSATPKAKGRVWDPRTDVEVMRQGSQNVLSKFAQM